jgi:hypothetical protein
MEVQAQGQRALIKKYDGDKDCSFRVECLFFSLRSSHLIRFQDWLRDVKVLQNL